MRFCQTKRGRHLWLAVLSFAVLVIGLWACFVVTRDPISASNFRNLKGSMPLSEVEAILGSPASKVEKEPDGNAPEFELIFTSLTGKLPTLKFGDWHPVSMTVEAAENEQRQLGEIHRWEGPEGKVCVQFNPERRLVSALFTQRVTWRYKLQEWLPWLK